MRLLGITAPQKRSQTNPTTKDPLMDNFFQLLKKVGFQPNHIMDVGANKGTWTRLAHTYFPQALFTLVEPQENLKVFIEDLLSENSKIKWFSLGAGAKDGSMLLTTHERDDSFSFRFSMEEALELGRQQIEVAVKTIETIVGEYNLPQPDLIKIDAEGIDLEVLEGASAFIGKTEVFMVEAAVMNKDFINDAGTVISFMKDKGYRLFDITDLNRTKKDRALWLAELAFIRKDGFIDQAITSYA
jgi:FkbM family methyltransferase